MTIASAITNAQNKIAAAYTALSNRGATLPATQNLSNMPSCINSIPSSSGNLDNFAIYGKPAVDRKTGAVTGFNSSNYLTIGKIDLTTADSWEMVAAFSLNALGYYQFIYLNPINFGLDNSNRLHIWGLPDGVIYSGVTFSSDIVYWVKLEFTGTHYNAYRKTTKDGEWEQIISFNSTNKVTNTLTPTYLGINSGNLNEYFHGDVLLNECYIKVDDNIVWEPKDKPNSFVVGNLTESDGALSEFSTSNYVDTNYIYSIYSCDETDVQIHFKTPATAFSHPEHLMEFAIYSNYIFYIGVLGNNEGVVWQLYTNQPYAGMQYTLENDTEYWIKLHSSGDGYMSIYISSDGTNWLKDSVDVSLKNFKGNVTLKVGIPADASVVGSSYAFEGQIFRDGTFIKVNNEIVWSLQQ